MFPTFRTRIDRLSIWRSLIRSSYSCYHQQVLITGTNVEATRLIKQLYSHKDKDRSKNINKTVIFDTAIQIYNQIVEHKNEYVINTMLSLCLFTKQPHQIAKLWNDIHSLLSIHSNANISYELLLKCFLHSKDHTSIDQIIQTLKWMQQCNYTQLDQKVYSTLLCKIISKHNTDIHVLRTIHSLIGFSYRDNIFIKTALMNAYNKYDEIPTVISIFDSIPPQKQDPIAITTMMKIYINHNCNEKALELYDSVFIKDNIIHSLAIKACTNTRDLRKGKQIHQSICEARHLGKHALDVMNALISLYGECGEVEEALNTFNWIQNDKKNVVSIGAMMKAYVNNGCSREALQLYESVGDINSNIKLNDICHIFAIKACTKTNNFEKGKSIIYDINCNEYSDINLINTGIDFYGHFYDIRSAIDTFKQTPHHSKNIGSINTMMDAYFRCNLTKQCINLFKSIPVAYRLQPDVTSYSIVLAACATDDKRFAFGRDLHLKLKQGDAELKQMLNHLSIQINLINMYGKNGRVEVCQDIFDDIKQKEYHKYCKEITIWNAMIYAYGFNGNIDKVKQLFDEMIHDIHLIPIKKTYAVLFNALGHCNDIDNAYNIWRLDIRNHDVRYDVYVITTLVDGLSRKGHLLKAYKLIRKYEMFNDDSYNDVMWTSLLSFCVKHEKTSLATRVYQQYQKRFGHDDQYINSMKSASLLMSNCNLE
eukprot:203004_1